MTFMQTCIGMATALMLTACSGGGGGAPFLGYPALPPQRPIHAAQAPVVAFLTGMEQFWLSSNPVARFPQRS